VQKPLVTIKLFKEAGSLKAFADLTMPTKFGEITIHRFKVLQHGDKRPWVAFPQIAYDKLLETHYWPLLGVSEKLERKIKGWIMGEYRKAIKEK
jgi:hypothetical protein